MSLAWDIDFLAAAEEAPLPGAPFAGHLPPPAALSSKSLGTGGGVGNLSNLYVFEIWVFA
jgi:hypothetical protein